MYKTIFSILTLIILAISLTAQNTSSLQWQHFSSPADGLEFDCPYAITMSGVMSVRSAREYRGGGNGTWFFIFSAPPDSQENVKGVAKFIKAMGHALEYGATPGSPHETRFRDTFGFWHNVRAYKHDDRRMIQSHKGHEVILCVPCVFVVKKFYGKKKHTRRR